MQKYVWNDAIFPVNISHELRELTKQESPGNQTEDLLAEICRIRAEIWSLLKESFVRFKATEDYRKLTVIITPNIEDKTKEFKKLEAIASDEAEESSKDLQESME